MITCGPKKAAYKYEDGSYTWVGNGIRARENTKLDVWQTYRNVLDGDVEQVNDFSIRATKDLQLIHTADATKKLRFLMTKGKVVGEGDGTRIQWWKDANEFEDYCNSIVPMNMAECWQRYKIKSGEKGRCPHNKNGFKTSQALADELKAWKDSQPKPEDVDMMKIDDALSQVLPDSDIDEITGRSIKADVRRITGMDTFTEPQRKRIRDQSDHFMIHKDIRPRAVKKRRCRDVCYILQCQGEPDIGYVGVTNDLDIRLSQHNLGVGAALTKGRIWEIVKYYDGFATRKQALQFESAVARHGNHMNPGCERGLLQDLLQSAEQTKSLTYYQDVSQHE